MERVEFGFVEFGFVEFGFVLRQATPPRTIRTRCLLSTLQFWRENLGVGGRTPRMRLLAALTT